MLNEMTLFGPMVSQAVARHNEYERTRGARDRKQHTVGRVVEVSGVVLYILSIVIWQQDLFVSPVFWISMALLTCGEIWADQHVEYADTDETKKRAASLFVIAVAFALIIAGLIGMLTIGDSIVYRFPFALGCAIIAALPIYTILSMQPRW